MKSPKPADTPINIKRRSKWQKCFSSYRIGVTEDRISDWLKQFKPADKKTAARLLDVIEFITAEELHAAFRALLPTIPGWHMDENQRTGKFAFVPFSSSYGESGDSMVHHFRIANSLNHTMHNHLFIGRSELLRSKLGANDTVVFIDDFVGTGTQAVTAWKSMFQELTAQIGKVILITVGAYQTGISKVRKETRMQLMPHRALKHKDNLFHGTCTQFTEIEKKAILKYCTMASPSRPKGYGDCGLVFVLYHQCPNNSLALLHESSRNWDPLFPRT